MGANEVHKNDIGTVFVATLKDGDSAVNLVNASTKQIIFKKPDGTTSTQSATFTTDGTNGKLQFTTTSGFLDTVGRWEIQAKVTISGSVWSSSTYSFYVYDNLV